MATEETKQITLNLTDMGFKVLYDALDEHSYEMDEFARYLKRVQGERHSRDAEIATHFAMAKLANELKDIIEHAFKGDSNGG